MDFVELANPKTGRKAMLNLEAILIADELDDGSTLIVTIFGAKVESALLYQHVSDAVQEAQASDAPE